MRRCGTILLMSIAAWTIIALVDATFMELRNPVRSPVISKYILGGVSLTYSFMSGASGDNTRIVVWLSHIIGFLIYVIWSLAEVHGIDVATAIGVVRSGELVVTGLAGMLISRGISRLAGQPRPSRAPLPDWALAAWWLVPPITFLGVQFFG